MNRDHLKEQLERQEAYRRIIYKCPAGYWTAGIGRNFETKGISKEEALFLLDNDINEVVEELSKYDWFNSLNDMRQNVIINMAFNLGIIGLLKFKNMINAIVEGDDDKVISNMKDSAWYHQVTNRANELIYQWENNPC